MAFERVDSEALSYIGLGRPDFSKPLEGAQVVSKWDFSRKISAL